MRNDQVPDDRLKGFGVRRYTRGIQGRDNHACIGHLRRISAVTAHDAENLRPARARGARGDR